MADRSVVDGPSTWRAPTTPPPADGLEGLRGGGGGPHDPVMEHRVANLEKGVDKLDSRMSSVEQSLNDIKVTLARMETELHHKISYKWLSLYVVGLAALILRAEIASLFGG